VFAKSTKVEPSPTNEYIVLLKNVTHLNGVVLKACGKLDGCINRLLHMLGAMYWQCH
jgi:hypothetical protein